ncbi:MAG: replication protein RepA [Gammaproteobacteria bacterium]|nr:replication protein RepA [Gammaproteobacteria bacterium]
MNGGVLGILTFMLPDFTRVNQLVEASEADPDTGFMARLMTLCSLPRTNPGNLWRHIRQNGPYKLIMVSGGESRLPYGNISRLLLAWVCTEAVRTKSRELVLGRSLNEFMEKLGLARGGRLRKSWHRASDGDGSGPAIRSGS